MAQDDDELQRHLERAPDDLRALRAGELDVVLLPPEQSVRDPFTRHSSERIYRLIVEQMREGAVLIPRGRDLVTYCNRSFARMVGEPGEQVVGGSLRRWLEPSDDGPSVTDLIDAEDDLRGDFELRNSTGDPRPVSVSAMLVRESDRTLRCLIVNDLRARRDVEHLRQVRAELEQAHQRKNEFLAMLGHELRNPLAPVRQAIELLQDEADPSDPDYLVRARSVLTRQINHLHRLVDDLLDVGRITKGTLALVRRPVDLREAISTGKESVERLLERRHHQVRYEMPVAPMMVDGDLVRLTQVFANLISNAAKYTHDGGRVEIVGQRDAGGYQVIVRDNGRGIEPEIVPYLFEPFVQSEATIDRSAGGIGVGLTLVRRIVELHQGRVEAHSEGHGHGSEFRVWLPAATVISSEPEIARGESITTPAARRILVVDDNEDAAEMLALVLRKRGYEVDLALEGEEALELAAEHDAEIVLLDIGLPGMDGYEVARRLRAQSGSRRLLVALTGYGQAEDRERSREAGFDHHLVKPVSIDALLELLVPRSS